MSEREENYTDHLDAIIAGFTPDEHSEFDGFVYEGDRAAVIEGLKAKGLLFSLDRLTALGGAVSHRKDWLREREPARQAVPVVSPQVSDASVSGRVE